MAQLVKCLILNISSGHDPRVVRSSPPIRLCTECGARLGFSLSLCSSPLLSLSNKNKIGRQKSPLKRILLSPSLSNKNKIGRQKSPLKRINHNCETTGKGINHDPSAFYGRLFTSAGPWKTCRIWPID